MLIANRLNLNPSVGNPGLAQFYFRHHPTVESGISTLVFYYQHTKTPPRFPKPTP